MHLQALDYVLWVLVPCLQGSVLFLLHRRGLARQFPFFYWYTLFEIVSDVYLLIAERLLVSALLLLLLDRRGGGRVVHLRDYR